MLSSFRKRNTGLEFSSDQIERRKEEIPSIAFLKKGIDIFFDLEGIVKLKLDKNQPIPASIEHVYQQELKEEEIVLDESKESEKVLLEADAIKAVEENQPTP